MNRQEKKTLPTQGARIFAALASFLLAGCLLGMSLSLIGLQGIFSEQLHTRVALSKDAVDRQMDRIAEQIGQMAAWMDEALARGCLGVSYGIRYIPGMTMEELTKTAAGCQTHGGIIAAHIRSDAAEVFDAAREFLDAAAPMGVPVQVSHIGSMAGFGQMDEFLALVDEYRAKYPLIRCDCYPYDAFSTGIGSTTYDEGWQQRYDCGYDVVELPEGKYKGQRCDKAIFGCIRYGDGCRINFRVRRAEFRALGV